MAALVRAEIGAITAVGGQNRQINERLHTLIVHLDGNQPQLPSTVMSLLVHLSDVVR